MRSLLHLVSSLSSTVTRSQSQPQISLAMPVRALPFLLTALGALISAAPAVPADAGAALPAIVQVDEASGAVMAKRLPQIDADYAPKRIACPNTPLIRGANGIGSDEASYVASRNTKAAAALAAWLEKQGNFSTASQPTVAMTSSGGGYRALLCTAGVVQALDGRDSSSTTSGLYQALTYQAGLSGVFRRLLAQDH